MTDEGVSIENIEQTADSVSQLRDEMNAQFSQLKSSFEQSLKEKDDLISQLKEQNQGLQRALVRSAVMDPPKQEMPKTPEEEYQEEVQRLSKRTIQLMKEVI